MADERDVVAPDYEKMYNEAEAKLKEVTSLVDQVKVHNEKLVAEVAELKQRNTHLVAIINAVKVVVR